MLLLNIKRIHRAASPLAPQYKVQVQETDGTVFESPLLNEQQTENAVKEVVIAMVGFLPLKNSLTIEATQLKKPLKDGIGLSDDHREFIKVKDGKVEVLEKDQRWMIARSLMLHVGKKILDRSFLSGSL
jgi:hypothetical protein